MTDTRGPATAVVPPAVPETKVALDRQDERFQAESGISGAAQAFLKRVRAGDIGSLPVIFGLIIVWTVFQSINSVFLSSTNLVNLALECCATGVIALGIVCVLLVGEIDLSVGSVSGLSAAILAVLFVNHHLPIALAVLIAMVVGAAIGLLYATLFNRLGMPSFVSTLSGLLAFLGQRRSASQPGRPDGALDQRSLAVDAAPGEAADRGRRDPATSIGGLLPRRQHRRCDCDDRVVSGR